MLSILVNMNLPKEKCFVKDEFSNITLHLYISSIVVNRENLIALIMHFPYISSKPVKVLNCYYSSSKWITNN